MLQGAVSTLSTQRLGMVAELPGILREMGADPEIIFAEVGMTMAEVSPAARLPLPSIVHVLTKAIQITGCDHIGILCGLRFRLKHHGIIGELMRTAPTLWQALADYVTWQPLYSNSAIVYLHRSGTDFAFGFGIYAGPTKGTRPIYDCILGVALRMARLLTGKKVSAVEFLHAHRDPRDATVYSRLLGSPVRFNQAQTSMILSEATLKLQLPGADPVLHRQILSTMRADGRWSGLSWSGRTRHELRRSLLSGAAHMDPVAQELGLSTRTLRRRLAEEGITFEAIRDDVRRTAASELLELTDLSMTEIAQALAFASPQVFAESFARWMGTTPSAWRSRLRDEELDERVMPV